VSDIFQFIVASNSLDIAPEDAEVVASSKSRSNSGAISSLQGPLPQCLLLHMALLLALALSNCQYDRRRLGLGLG
ncbi:GL16690, partial [Drosophila persimilis]